VPDFSGGCITPRKMPLTTHCVNFSVCIADMLWLAVSPFDRIPEIPG
jgi:hypothetical protein